MANNGWILNFKVSIEAYGYWLQIIIWLFSKTKNSTLKVDPKVFKIIFSHVYRILCYLEAEYNNKYVILNYAAGLQNSTQKI